MLADAILGDESDILAENFAKLTKRYLLAEFASINGSGRLWAFGMLLCLLKPNGEPRPIVVSGAKRRLIERIVMNYVADYFVDLTMSHNTGVLEKGLDVYVHTMRQVREKMLVEGSTDIIFILDFKNAFNSIKRYLIVWVVALFIPVLAMYVWWCYKEDTHLVIPGGKIVKADRGSQQGSYISCLIFGLVMLSIILMTMSVKLALKLYYWDDMVVKGTGIKVLEFILLLSVLQEFTGLELKWEKCIAHAKDEVAMDSFKTLANDALPPDAKMTFKSDLNMVCLGQSVGEPEWVDDHLIQHLTDKVIPALERVEKMPKRHEAWHITRMCLSECKIAHIFACHPPDYRRGFTQLWSRTIKVHCAKLLGDRTVFDKNNGERWTRAQLPASAAGVSIPTGNQTSAVRYVQSVVDTAHYVKMMSGIESDPVLALLETCEKDLAFELGDLDVKRWLLKA